MKNKKVKILKVLKYGFLFLFFLYALMVSYNVFFGDTIVNYGFSYAIRRGEIPYRDFNLVIPLFSPFLYSLSLIFFNNIISLYIMQAVLLVLFFELLERILDGKVYILLPLLFLGFPICLFAAFFPGYNFILLFLIVLLIFLEKEDRNDYLIGFVIGLAIITKHTIGIFLILPSLVYLKRDFKKLLKRAVGIVIPCFIFLLYLIITRSVFSFFNLCILGIFDFANKNTTFNNVYLLGIFLFCLVYTLFSIVKRPREVINYYVLIGSLFVYPLLDNYHLAYFIILVLILILNNRKKEIENKRVILNSIIFSLFLNGLWTVILFNLGNFEFKNYNNYVMRLMNSKMNEEYSLIDKYLKDKKKKFVLLGLGTENYFYKITNDMNITYFDLPNYGNYGYNGYKLMVKRFETLKDTIVLVNSNAVSEKTGQQYYKELALYVRNNFEHLEDVGEYEIYYRK